MGIKSMISPTPSTVRKRVMRIWYPGGRVVCALCRACQEARCGSHASCGWPSGIWYGEATPRAPGIVTVFLHGRTHQLRQERLGEVTHLWMLQHHVSKRAAIAADTEMTVTRFKFCHPAEFIKVLDSRPKSHAQIS